MTEGLKSGEVKVAPYSPDWPVKYAAEERLLQQTIGPLIEEIQHIGSTAIPGLAAKPIIDIAVAVANLATVEALIAPLQTIGYEYRGLLNGIAGHYFFRKGDPRVYFLHLFAHHSDFWRRRLAFRDYLRAHSAVAADYVARKRLAAAQHPNDRDAYTASKQAFIEQVTTLALQGIPHPVTE